MSSGFNVSVVVSCLKSFMSHPIKMLSTSIEQNGTQHRIFDSGPAVSGSCWDGLLFIYFFMIYHITAAMVVYFLVMKPAAPLWVI